MRRQHIRRPTSSPGRSASLEKTIAHLRHALAERNEAAKAVIEILDTKPIGLDEGDWALVERLRKLSEGE
jgi:hypothetical protein